MNVPRRLLHLYGIFEKKNVYHFLLLLLLIYSEASMEIDMEVPCDVQDEDDDFD